MQWLLQSTKQQSFSCKEMTRTGNLSSFFAQSVHISSQANVRDVYAGLTGADGEEIRWDFSKG